ncbi:MAG: hypothetical protein QNL12_15315 [Acidimicrobiia bacterium]|nr:hypothetical protein [Acidimicrobiia bacterium]MDX2468683.1 hypothetical protein [Acidimicrobiia bacterium]
MSWLLAHQGGWDEILMFLVPIGLAFFVIRGLERRGRRVASEEDSSEEEPSNGR